MRVYGRLATTVCTIALSVCVGASEPDVRATSMNASGLPSFIEGRLARIESRIDEASLRRAAREVAPLFRIDGGTLELERVKRDDLGMTHARFRQVAHGLEVVGGELLVHVGRDGVVFAANGSSRERALPDPTPRIDAEAATRVALRRKASAAEGKPRLTYVISTHDRSLHLAWEVMIAGSDDEGPFRDAVYVEACNGAIVDVHPQNHHALVRRIYSLADAYYLPGTLMRDEGDVAALDPVVNRNYDNLGRVYQCFLSLFGRDSYDGRGAAIISSVHFGYRASNAAWNGQQFWFGDGDGGGDWLNFALAYDIAAHEFTHGVTQFESKLFYQNESGALSESFSDVFAAVCESLFPPPAAEGAVNPWHMMETIYTPGFGGDAYRYMDTPTRDGISFDYYPERILEAGDNGGVHKNSGISNLAFYLLANGGRHPRQKTLTDVPAIGVAKAGQIFYRASAEYMTSGTSFLDARAATSRAASDLYPGEPATISAVGRAWEAVGVGGSLPDPPPNPQPIVFPAAPSALIAKATAPGQIDLSWVDNSTVETGFKIERRSGSSAFAEIARVNSNVTTFTNTGLAASTAYTYRVRSYNSNGSSAYTNESSATTAKLDLPVAPSALRSTNVQSSTLQLLWTHEGNNEDGFIIERGIKLTDVVEVGRVGRNVFVYEDRGLKDATTYLYRVRAYNGTGVSAPSNVHEVRTLADLQGCCSSHEGVCGCTGDVVTCCDGAFSPTCRCSELKPAAPINLAVRPDSISNIVLTWRDASTNESAFFIERSKNYVNFTTIGVVGANATQYVDRSAGSAFAAPAPAPRYDQPTGTVLSYRVRACRSVICSDPSNTVQFATDCRGSINPQKNTVAKNGGSGRLDLAVFSDCTWGVIDAPAWVTLANRSGKGSGSVAYSVAANPGGPRTGYITMLSGHPLVVGWIIHEIQQDGIVVPPPQALALNRVSANAVQLQWQASATGGSYAVERRDVCEQSFSPIAVTGTTSYTDSARASGAEYVYRVRTIDAGLDSKYSAVVPELGVGSSCSGGMESGPLWRWTGTGLWNWTNRLRPRSAIAEESSILADLFPPALPFTTRRASPPRDVIGLSNAVETVGYDYVNASSRNVAAIAGFRSTDAAYANDYAVCSRFKAGRLTSVAPVLLRPDGAGEDVWFWRARVEHDDRAAEWAITFAVFADASGQAFSVDSEWINEAYRSNHKGDVLTFQVWAESPENTASLVLRILERLASFGTVTYENRREPPGTNVFASRATYAAPNIVVHVTNGSETPRELTFTAVAWSAAAPTPERRQVFLETVPPGESTIELPMPDFLSGVVYVDDGHDFVDKLFVADGNWFGFDSGATADTTLDSSACTSAETLAPIDRHVAGCANLRGAIGTNGYAGFARALDSPAQRDIDATRWAAVTFFAKGDRKNYRMSIETDAARLAGAPSNTITFTAPPEGRQFIVPLRAFAQPGDTPAAKRLPMTGAGVRVLSWATAGSPHNSVELSVGHVAFTNSVIISETTMLPDTPAKGPYRITTRVTDDTGLSEVSLVIRYRNDAFGRVSMVGSGADPALFTAEIPPAAFGSKVSYYIEATDDSGNVATDPFNAPVTTYQFQYAQAPYLELDDFADTDPLNLRGGGTFLFGTESGAAVTAHYDRERLRLTWDTMPAGSYAGYFTSMDRVDLRRYDALTFRIRGATGGERVKAGVKYGPSHEHKLLVGQHLPAGISREWQTVVIPFAAFAPIRDWSAIEGFVIVLENHIGSAAGSIELDDLRFETRGPLSIPMDNFDDRAMENALGGSLSTAASGGATASGTYETTMRRGATGAAYAFTYAANSPAARASVTTDLLGADLSATTALSFFIRGAAGGERPRIYLTSGTGAAERRAFADLAPVSTSWGLVSMPVTAFTGIDLHDVRSLAFVFESVPANGTIFLEDVRFLRARRRAVQP